MSSFIHWMRLEPRTRNEPSESGLESGLEARTADPCWMIARQWQFGELQGEDAGSPVSVRAELDQLPFTRFRPGARRAGAPAHDYDPRELPLEALVEREAVHPLPLRLAATAGQHFLRLLAKYGVDKYHGRFVRAFALQAPPPADADKLLAADRAFLAVMSHRVPDANKLYAVLKPVLDEPVPRLPDKPSVDPADRGNVALAGIEWLRWFESLYSEPENDSRLPSTVPAWVPERQEYAFAVAAEEEEGQLVLEADEYTEGDLDWYVFDRMPDASLGRTSSARTTRRISRTVIPTPVRYRGMPSTRWWEFEDGRVNFGAAEAEATDLVRLLLIEYSISHGDDWFVMPIELELGAAYRALSVVVTDTFGERTLIRPYTEVDGPGSPWRMFETALHRDAPGSGSDTLPTPEAPLLVYPPVLVNSIPGQAIEEVHLLRDEMANMAWAVEEKVESPVGFALDRARLFQERKLRADEDNESPPTRGSAGRLLSSCDRRAGLLDPARSGGTGHARQRPPASRSPAPSGPSKPPAHSAACSNPARR